MKVLILTEGGSKIGFGHITRCLALYEALNNKKINSEMVINGDETILGLLAYKNFKIHDWLKGKENLCKSINNYDFVIIDSYLANESIYYEISKVNDSRILMIDDFGRIDYPGGIIVNPSIYGDSILYNKDSKTEYLLGKDYIILRKEFWKVSAKNINREIKDILITGGGTSKDDFLYSLVEFLKNNYNSRLHLLDSLNNKFSAKEMLNMMSEFDVCISGGGQTINELARTGMPSIGICFAENQVLNLTNWQKTGFLDYVGYYKEKNISIKILEALGRLKDYKNRFKKCIIGRSCVDGRGAERIVNSIINKMEL